MMADKGEQNRVIGNFKVGNITDFILSLRAWCLQTGTQIQEKRRLKRKTGRTNLCRPLFPHQVPPFQTFLLVSTEIGNIDITPVMSNIENTPNELILYANQQ